MVIQIWDEGVLVAVYHLQLSFKSPEREVFDLNILWLLLFTGSGVGIIVYVLNGRYAGRNSTSIQKKSAIVERSGWTEFNLGIERTIDARKVELKKSNDCEQEEGESECSIMNKEVES